MAWNEISKTKQSLLIFFIPAVLFSIILLAFYPTYHSADDNYFLYEMSGANGNGATNLLQYDYGMHPYLIYPVKFMFGIFPGVNWYSLLLYCLHFLSWVIIFKAFLDRFALWDAMFIGTVLFFVFGAQFLLRVTYTNTSAVTAIAALTHLMSTVSAKGKVDRVDCIMSAVLLIMAGLLRVHVIIPFAGLCLVFFAAYPARKLLPVFFVYATVIAGLFVLNLIQKDYYRAHITDWDQKMSIAPLC